MSEVLCIVEIPKGSRNKHAWDPEHNLMPLDHFLSASVVLPVDYGFVPDTLDQKGEDPLDVLIAVSEPTFSGLWHRGQAGRRVVARRPG